MKNYNTPKLNNDIFCIENKVLQIADKNIYKSLSLAKRKLLLFKRGSVDNSLSLLN